MLLHSIAPLTASWYPGLAPAELTSDQHHDDAENFLTQRRRRNVAEAHGCKAGEGEI